MPEVDEALPDTDTEPDGRSFGALGTILLIVTVVVIALLLWRSCAPASENGSGGSAEREVETVEGLEPVDGGVAVWLKPGNDIETVLERNGLSGATATDMGEGTWVIDVGEADAGDAVRKLEDDPALYDAGFLYTDTGNE